MENRGFIQDKLEIKFLILYIADRLIEPVPYDVILDLAMCDSGVGYFDFSGRSISPAPKAGSTPLRKRGGGTAPSANPASLTPCASAATGIWPPATGGSGGKARSGPPAGSGPTVSTLSGCPWMTTWAAFWT